MNVKKLSKTVTGIFLVGLVAIALAWYALDLFVHCAVAGHVQGMAASNMVHVYKDLCKYRERNRRWPKSLPDAVKEKEASIGEGDIVDRVSDRPLLYYPDAKPGTKALLLAQPEPLEIGLWPFVTTERLGIRADGKFVNVKGDEKEVDDSKIRQDYRAIP